MAEGYCYSFQAHILKTFVFYFGVFMIRFQELNMFQVKPLTHSLTLSRSHTRRGNPHW